MLRLVFSFLMCVLFVAAQSSDWSYDGPTGPAYWCNLPLPGNQCCGDRQSPINIDTSNTVAQNFQVNAGKLNRVFSHFNITNDQHTVSLHFPTDEGLSPASYITIWNNIKPISDQYYLDTMHFHFGSESSVGSEHQIDGQVFPMESHTIFYNSKYSSFTEAKLYPDGVIVFGTHFIISNNDNGNFQPVVMALENVLYVNQLTTVRPGIAVYDLIPNDLSAAYSYEGSLTTPICNEVVQWFVLKLKVPISESQLEKFRALTILDPPTNDLNKAPADGDNYMADNFRPVQPLNDRIIYT